MPGTYTTRPGLLLAISYLGFVSLGLPDTVLGVAWPSVRDTFRLQQADIGWIFLGTGCSYFISSFWAGRFMMRINIGVLLAISSALVAISNLDYGLARVWPLFAAGSLLHGLGSGAIDASLNHYAASHFSTRHMNWLHASYSLGAMLGPLVMTGMIAWGSSWRNGYLLVAGCLLTLTFLFISTKERWNDSQPQVATVASESPQPGGATARVALRNGLVWLHILVFFIYTGLEVAIGQWSFTVLVDGRNIPPERAGIWVTIYWASILVGRIVIGSLVDRLGIDRSVRLSILTAFIGTGLLAWNPVSGSEPVALALAGLGLAVIFPSLTTRTPQRLGKAIAVHAIGFQLGAAMLGAAALPGGTGLVAQYLGLNSVPVTLFLLATALLVLHEVVVIVTARPKAV